MDIPLRRYVSELGENNDEIGGSSAEVSINSILKILR